DVLAAVGILGFISICVWRSRRSRPYLWVGWCWFVGSMVPVIGMVQVGLQAMADRYTYFPGIGLLLMAVWGTNTFLEHPKCSNWRGSCRGIQHCDCLERMDIQIGYLLERERESLCPFVGRQSGEFRGSLPSGRPVLGRRKNQ